MYRDLLIHVCELIVFTVIMRVSWVVIIEVLFLIACICNFVCNMSLSTLSKKTVTVFRTDRQWLWDDDIKFARDKFN